MSVKVPKVLVVDDGKEITDLIYSYGMYYKREFSTLVTNRPEDVLGILQKEDDIRIIVTDFRMPTMNGLELFFKVRDKHPFIQFIMMTGFGTPELRSKAESGGFVCYLEKPFRIIELIEKIREILQRQEKGFQGFMPSLELPDIIQLLALSKGDASLEITASENKGYMYFESGELIHAKCDSTSGVEAFQKMFLWKSGKFLVNDLIPGVERTIVESWQGLLIDAARLEDEANVKEAASSEETVTAQEPQVELESVEDGAADRGRSIGDEILFDILGPEETAPLAGRRQVTPPRIFTPDEHLLNNIPDQPAETLELPVDVSRTAVGDLSLVDAEKAMEDCAAFYRQQFPKEAESVSIRELPTKTIHPLLRQHLAFHFHWVSTSTFRIDETPFDLNNEKIANAAYELLHALLETWKISKQEYASLIRDAVRFHLARSIHPAAALGEFLFFQTEGKMQRLKQLASSLISQGVIEKRFDPVVQHIRKFAGDNITQDELEALIMESLSGMHSSDVMAELVESAQRLLEISSIGKPEPNTTLQQEAVRAMLEARNLPALMDSLVAAYPGSDSAVSPAQFTDLISRQSG